MHLPNDKYLEHYKQELVEQKNSF